MDWKTLEEQAQVSQADRYLAEHLMSLSETPDTLLEQLIALTSAQIRQGNVCLPLSGRGPLARLGIAVAPERLLKHPLVGLPEAPDERPLIVDGQRLYLARYHKWEQQVIQVLERLLRHQAPAVKPQRLAEALRQRFPDTQQATDWQRVAAALAITRSLCIISGGPGTGKTYTVARILDLLLQMSEQPLRIGLAAPTGKAAGRLTESIRLADERLLKQVDKAQTLHRLLGMRPGRIQPRYHAEHPLPLDVLIVDEVSMVDLPMMARLLNALPEQARLILLGDRFQLASVEAGRIMADICGPAEPLYPPALAEEIQQLGGDTLPLSQQPLPAMAGHVVSLRHSRRFAPDQGIGRLAEAVNRGDADAVDKLLRLDDPAIHWHSSRPGALKRLIQQQLIPEFKRIAQAEDARTALQNLDRMRLLCAVRQGPQGMEHLNRNIETYLGHEPDSLYHGRPIMITVNDYEQQLFNGDLGLLLKDENGLLKACFYDDDNGLRQVLPARLPRHETAYAMTVHKSQGSEFNTVILVLPDMPSPVVTRELFYTGITRARQQVILCASPTAIKLAVEQQVERFSGLYEAIWQGYS